MNQLRNTTCPATGRPCRRGCFGIGPNFCDDPPGGWRSSPAIWGTGIGAIIAAIMVLAGVQ